jgi:hypothetical protein
MQLKQHHYSEGNDDACACGDAVAHPYSDGPAIAHPYPDGPADYAVAHPYPDGPADYAVAHPHPDRPAIYVVLALKQRKEWGTPQVSRPGDDGGRQDGRSVLRYQAEDPSSTYAPGLCLDSRLPGDPDPDPEPADEIFAAYTATDPGQDPTDMCVDIMSAYNLIIPTVFLADAHSAHGPVSRSRWDGPITGLPKRIAPAGQLAAFHGTDGTRVWTGGDAVSGERHSARGRFVTTGQPAISSGQTWPRYTPEQRPTMIFSSAQTRVEEDPDATRRSAWNGRLWRTGTWYRFDGIS